jgi:hypothetical protein
MEDKLEDIRKIVCDVVDGYELIQDQIQYQIQ